MKTTSCIVLILITGIISSCNQIRFNSPLPSAGEPQLNVPEELRGSFVGMDLKNDTLLLDSLQLRRSSEKKAYSIGKDLIIKKVGNKFFINVNTEHWELGIATQLNNTTWQLETFAFDPEDPNPFITDIKKIMKLTSLKSGDYLANPTDRQLEKVLISNPLPSSLFEKVN